MSARAVCRRCQAIFEPDAFGRCASCVELARIESATDEEIAAELAAAGIDVKAAAAKTMAVIDAAIKRRDRVS